jgi:malate dehydrogenase (oxaloacetate-decarboxylating)(NADP+)
MENIIMTDRSGVIYKGRVEGMNKYKEPFARDISKRSLADAMQGADVFVGLSQGGLVTPAMVKTMAAKPIIFAMANPDPEIGFHEARAARPDCIMATGRSDFPNQVNNVLGFPFIFRGALDVRAREINEPMKVAATHALANLAKKRGVPKEVLAAYKVRSLSFGPDYIIPKPLDPRVLVEESIAVAKAAMDSGVAAMPIKDFDAYRSRLKKLSKKIQKL